MSSNRRFMRDLYRTLALEHSPHRSQNTPLIGSLLIRVGGRGGAAGRRQRRQAAVAAAGAAALATTTASSAAARSMGSARPAPRATPLATKPLRPVRADDRSPAPPARPSGRPGAGAVPVGGVLGEEGLPAEAERAAHQRPVPADGPVGADLEVGPAELAFDLLVALLDPVAQPVQAHDLGQVGRLGAAAGGSGQVGQQVPGAVRRAAWPGRWWPPPAAAAGPGPSRQAGRRPPTRSRCGRRGSGGWSAATARAGGLRQPSSPAASTGVWAGRPAPRCPCGLEGQHERDLGGAQRVGEAGVVAVEAVGDHRPEPDAGLAGRPGPARRPAAAWCGSPDPARRRAAARPGCRARRAAE